jgi:hypothetical protein
MLGGPGQYLDHPGTNGFGGDLAARHRHDHTRLADDFHHTHPELERDAIRDGEEALDRLNPNFGVPADQHNPHGQQALQGREAALALAVRVAVHDSRQNDRDPVIWQAGQDCRMADAITVVTGGGRHCPGRKAMQRHSSGDEVIGWG